MAETIEDELGPPDRGPYRLRYESKLFELVYPEMGALPGNFPPGDKLGQVLSASEARQLLNRFAEDSSNQESLDREAVLHFLREMAIWGDSTYKNIFTQANSTVRDAVQDLKQGVALNIDTEAASFPWEWLYIGEVPRPGELERETGGGLDLFLCGFWGLRFELDITPRFCFDRRGLKHKLINTAKTVTLAAVNRSATPLRVSQRNLELFEKELPERYLQQIETKTYKDKAEAIQMMKDALRASNPPHVLYFYAHHRGGKGVNELGFLSHQDSVLYLSGEDGGQLSVKELKYDEKLPPFQGNYTPLVFLNACGTAQGQDFFPSGFVPYFIAELRAASVLATLAKVPALHATGFAKEFLESWLGGVPAARALRDIRWRCLRDQLNPFPMYYTLHGLGSLQLARPLSCGTSS